MTQQPHAAILAIGTEITTGDIVNSNSSWISAKLSELGIETKMHLVVPDEQTLILQSLKALETYPYIFVTGGLGPTSDDLTRDLVSTWSGQKLKFNIASWQRISQMLSSRGVAVAESNRKQCFFPENSQILENAHGTADGFIVEKGQTTAIVLPGPPRELQGIWNDHLHAKFQALIPESERLELKVWQCIGESESKLGEIVEEIVQGSSLKTGYRARIPYVDIKIWCQKDQWKKFDHILARLDSALKPFLIARDRDDVVELFLETLLMRTNGKDLQIQIIDVATNGILISRIQQHLSKPKFSNIVEKVSFVAMSINAHAPLEFALDLAKTCPAQIAVIVAGIDHEGRWSLYTKFVDKTNTQTHRARLKGKHVKERNQKMIAELVAKYCLQEF